METGEGLQKEDEKANRDKGEKEGEDAKEEEQNGKSEEEDKQGGGTGDGVRAAQKYARLVMRAKGNLRLLLNANVFPAMKISRMDGRGISFTCVNTASAGVEDGKDGGEKGEKGESSKGMGLRTFALRMRDVDTANKLMELMEQHKDL